MKGPPGHTAVPSTGVDKPPQAQNQPTTSTEAQKAADRTHAATNAAPSDKQVDAARTEAQRAAEEAAKADEQRPDVDQLAEAQDTVDKADQAAAGFFKDSRADYAYALHTNQSLSNPRMLERGSRRR